MYKQLTTKKGYNLNEVVSVFQKAIRRGDTRLAGYFGIELFESGYQEYAWRRTLTVSAEDCFGIITTEIKALYDSWKVASQGNKLKGRIFFSKAIIILSECLKSRDADHLTNLVYDKDAIEVEAIDAAFKEARDSTNEKIPDYAFDVHTMKGKYAGKTKKQFFIDEQEALKPRQVGLFDQDVEQIK
jgi:replication-associated recombination protein RarA